MSSSESIYDISYIDYNSLIVHEDNTDSSTLILANHDIDLNLTATCDSIDVEACDLQPVVDTNTYVTKSKPKTPLIFSGIETHGGAHNRIYLTPNGTKCYKPDVPAEFIPPIGTSYTNWDDVVAMYDAYADKAGFVTRLGTFKQCPNATSYRFMHCNRSGKPRLGNYSMANRDGSTRKKSTRFKVINCKACIRLKILRGTTNYVLYDWIELHNHPLIGQEFMDFSKKRRAITYTEQHLIHSLNLHNIGPNRAHKMQCTLKGGHNYVRGKTTDFKNFQRSIRLFIGEKDAKLTVDTLVARTKNLHNFFFDFKAEDSQVKALFWADDVSRCHYAEFGDVLAFDATYKTNKYKMIFVPFTGVDHHKKCVTFGAGLICDETIESYLWLLNKFLEAHTKQPKLVLTDQDNAMRHAVIEVFHDSSHRLCMWHIMKKLPAKFKGCNVDNEELRKNIHKLVWDLLIDKDTFEKRWAELVEAYDLREHTWLNEMYGIRHRWVPCYFNHIDMCCLMKTTSRCESSNAMFKVYTNSSNTLLQFLMCFDTAIDGQRHNQRELEFTMMTTTPLYMTPLPIEEHASDVYTPSLFREVQKEIHRGMLSCSIGPTTAIGGVKIFTVAQYDKQCNVVCEFKVTFNIHCKTVSCSCMRFTQIGYLCRHVFCVFRYEQVHIIPDRYITKRWRRDSLPRRVYDVSHRYSVDNREETRLRNEILDMVGLCADRLRRDTTQLRALCEQIKELKIKVFAEVPYDPECYRTNAVISDLLRVPENVNATLVMPQGIRTKGCGRDKVDNTNKQDNSNKRFVGPREKAVERYKKGKAPRMCGKCKKYVTGHNAQTCDKIQAAKASAATKARAVKNSVNALTSDTTSLPDDPFGTQSDARMGFDSSQLASELYSGIMSLSVSGSCDPSQSSDSRNT